MGEASLRQKLGPLAERLRPCRAILFFSLLSVPSAVHLPFFAPALAETSDAGARALQKCYSCHSVDPKETKLSGPNLAGVIGRRAASQPGFEYSPAMRKAGEAGLVWSGETLERYLADPSEMVPDTTMSFPGMRNPDERRAVIEYLRRFH